jgi:hypothetical protein
MTTPEALKALYVALGGDADDVATANTSVDVLNAIAVKFEGDGDATLNPDAIMNVVAVLDNMIPDPTLIDKNITANGTYNASSDEADGYKKVVVDVPVNNNNSNVVRSSSSATTFQVAANVFEKITVPEGYQNLYYDTSGTATLKTATNLKEITIPSTLTSISTAMFTNCTLLEKITLNKPEGSIEGAPWGAPASCQVVWAG